MLSNNSHIILWDAILKAILKADAAAKAVHASAFLIFIFLTESFLSRTQLKVD